MTLVNTKPDQGPQLEPQSANKWPSLKLSEEACDLISKILLGIGAFLITAAALTGMALCLIVVLSNVPLEIFLISAAVVAIAFIPIYFAANPPGGGQMHY